MKDFAIGLTFLSAFVLSFTMGFGLGYKNAEYRSDDAKWQSIMPPEPPDVCSLMDEHLGTPGNWVGIETQINEDCGLRFIVELGTGDLAGVGRELFDQPEPTPAPRQGIDPSQVGGAL